MNPSLAEPRFWNAATSVHVSVSCTLQLNSTWFQTLTLQLKPYSHQDGILERENQSLSACFIMIVRETGTHTHQITNMAIPVQCAEEDIPSLSAPTDVHTRMQLGITQIKHAYDQAAKKVMP